MNLKESLLVETIEEIKGNGAFMSSDCIPFVTPGLSVVGFGELSMPIISEQLKALIALATQAPFGKGSQTITDTSVRNTWEVDASELSFLNPAWEASLSKIINKTKKDLGIEDKEVEAHLYKLLIYEEGGFFKAHKDSEKEDGMFGTLIIGLPSAHTGGELSLRFDGTEKSVNFHDHPTYEMPFVSFYGDCEHEISPVTSGYRVCLAYNLVSNKKKTITQPKAAKHYVKKLSTILAHTMSKEENLSAPQLLLLDHQYTPTNFSLNELKGNDRLRAVSLLEAAEGSPYHAKLCLLTHYQMGELEGGYDFDRYRNYGDSNEKGEMGEIYEEYSQVKHWGEDRLPSMGELDVSNSNFINKLQINGNPIEEYEEGYTGNAGMSMEYWLSLIHI